MAIYLPPHFEQTSVDSIVDLVEAFPLATLVTVSAGAIIANHIPMQLTIDGQGDGILRGHVARKNAVWQEADTEVESLAIFQAPDAYITPNWYASKQTSHEVVPTWNYAVVHAYGTIVFHDDEKWLRGVIGKLTRSMESDQPKPWSMGQAPRDYLTAQLRDIVGVELPISRLIGKWKMSQNRSETDQDGVISGLRQGESDRGIWIADRIAAAKLVSDKH